MTRPAITDAPRPPPLCPPAAVADTVDGEDAGAVPLHRSLVALRTGAGVATRAGAAGFATGLRAACAARAVLGAAELANTD